MGFWGSVFSGVCSVVGTIGSAIGGAISTVCTAIGGIGSALGSAVSGFAGALGVVGSALGIGPLQIAVVAMAVVSKIAESLGIKNKGEDEPDELAMKAEISDKKPDDFDSTEAYINHLHDEIKLDFAHQKKLREMDPERRAAYQFTGSYLYLKACAEKLGLDDTTIKESQDIRGFDAQFLVDAYKLGLSGNEIVTYVKSLQAQGINDTKSMSEYLHNKAESLEVADKVMDAIAAALREENPQIGDGEINLKINEMRERV